MMEGWLAAYYLAWGTLEEPSMLYGINWEEQETKELITFVQLATEEVRKRGLQAQAPAQTVRITRGLRVYIGAAELKVRPMAKSILLLFLKHPEGIPLKQIPCYRAELSQLYGRVSRSSDPHEIDTRVTRMMDLFNNDLNVNIARVNKALSSLADNAQLYQIRGKAGHAKGIYLDRKWVIWE